ncbi:MAG: M14 family metallopeptidase [Gemmatimonadales bacterium]
MHHASGYFRPTVRLLALCAGGLVPAVPLLGQGVAGGYHSHAAMTAALDSVRRANPGVVTVTTIGTSYGKRPLAAVRLAAGPDADSRPALLIIANAYGPDVISSEAALAVVKNLAGGYGRDSGVKRLLDARTVYVIPRANPDAAEAMFRSPLGERLRNDEPRDDDRDWSVDEDGPEDINGDGLITMMRVEDPAGEWVADSAEPGLMRKADAGKGEAARYRLYTEGRDDDGDERWNEDPAGGTGVDRNFSYGYEFFAAGTGDYPFAAPEARAVAQFMVDHPNIAAVYVLGPQDNLLKPWEHKRESGGGAASGSSEGRGRSRQPLTSILEEDAPFYAEMARRYQKVTGLEKGPASAALEGDPLSWAYYHMGRWAWGTRTWWIPEVPADSGARKGGGKTDTKDPLQEERNALRWLREHRPDGFVAWTRVNHPDFPGKVVEVGGFRPYVLMNPPIAELDSIAARQTRFTRELIDALPSLALRDVRVERLGDRVFRVTAQVANNGYLPSVAQIGERVRWPLRVKVQLATNGQQISGGRAIQILDPLPGSGQSTELSWLLIGPSGSRITLTASSPVAGAASQTITLR